MTRSKKRRIKHHVIITLAVVISSFAVHLAEALAPGFAPFAPLTGLGANLLWIWMD